MPVKRSNALLILWSPALPVTSGVAAKLDMVKAPETPQCIAYYFLLSLTQSNTLGDDTEERLRNTKWSIAMIQSQK